MTTSIKTCFKCNKTKYIAEFYKHSKMADGHLNKCKECTKRDVKKYNKTYCNIVWGDGKSKDAYIKRNPKKRAAHIKVNNAIRDGKLKKQPCEICGAKKVEAHHADYNKPLDVQWLCRKHHALQHSKEDNPDV